MTSPVVVEKVEGAPGHVCPINSDTTQWTNCIGRLCQWWLDASQGCAVRVLAEKAITMEEDDENF